MSSAVSTTGVNLGGSSTSEIKFSQLRTTFLEKSSGSASASSLIRDTNTSNTNPTVPDATENSSIASSQSNWKLGQFNQSIKYYDVTQSDTDVNYVIQDQTWNSNLGKNIKKRMIISGQCQADSNSYAACRFNDNAYNLTVEVSGQIYGWGGRGGGQPGAPDAISGENGGRALRVTSGTGSVTINVKGTGQIYAGGGGGERGKNGADGVDGKCHNDITVDKCKNCPDCPSGWTVIKNCYSGGSCARKQCPAPGEFGWGHYWCPDGDTKKKDCRGYTYPSKGLGGAGGLGGNGRGANNIVGTTAGGTGDDGGGAGDGASTSSFSSSWSVTGGDNVLLTVSGSGGQGYCKMKIFLDTNDNPNTNGQSYNKIILHNGPSSSDSSLVTWDFQDGTSRNYAWNATAKSYLIEIKKSSGVPNTEISNGNVKLKDKDGTDTNASISKTLNQTTKSGTQCPSGWTQDITATAGAKGEDGGAGGDWGKNGGSTTNTGSGGTAADAIYGSNFSLTGSTSSSNIKGTVTKV